MPVGLVAKPESTPRKGEQQQQGLAVTADEIGAGARDNAVKQLVIAARLPEEKNTLSLLALHRQEMTAAA